MQPIVIRPKNSTELRFINDLLGRLGIRSDELPEEVYEDIGLAMLMREADTNEKVSEDEIMRKLKG